MQTTTMIRAIAAAALPLAAVAADLHVAPSGLDTHPGTREQPLASLDAARKAARPLAGKEPVTIWFHDGVYYLPETVRFEAADSGTADAPVLYSAAPGAAPVLSGGTRLELEWKPGPGGIFLAETPPGLVMDQLFVNGNRQPMARYPNYDAEARPYNGAAADAFSKERAARWSDPVGGYIHAMHRAHWGGYHYRITGKTDDGEVAYEGGWQNNRQMGMHPEDRFVENIFEELDAPGEWFHNVHTNTLHYMPPEGLTLPAALVEVVRLRHLVEFNGTPDAPVRHLTLRGFTFRHAARTFMDVKEPLLRSDWTIYRGGAVRFDGAEDCTVAGCEFDQVGGNAVFVNNYNRRITITGCDIHDSGASAVAFVGDPGSVRSPLFEYHQQQSYADLDQTPGPKTGNHPADCLVDDCLLRRFGQVEKQATGVQVSMSSGITIRHCSIYEASRAGINISEGTHGGHLIEFCDVFDTVRETGDHGSFNSWGRDRFWHLKDAPAELLPELALLDMVKPNIIRNSRWRCDHGWDVDLDDGSSHYQIYNNLFLHGGLKLREGFHRRVWNNITVNNSLHPHVWYDNSQDVVTGNIFMAAYRPAGGMPKGRWGKEVDRNLFTNEADRTKFAGHGCDARSLTGDPMFLDPANGDFRVQPESPALKIGFVNFPMDRFGVRKPELKAMARTPEIPSLAPASGRQAGPAASAAPAYWLQSPVRNLGAEEFSAYGVAKEAGGVVLVEVPASSPAAANGFQTNDLVQTINGKPARSVDDLWKLRDEAGGEPLTVGCVRNQQSLTLRVSGYPFVRSESAAAPAFQTLPLSPEADLAAIRSVATRPDTSNEAPSSLHDGRLAAGYGPVFRNKVAQGLYKVDLGRATAIAGVGTWSFHQNGTRGTQRFTLFGSTSEADPGWDLDNRSRFIPIASVRSTCSDQHLATRIHSPANNLGSFRWLLWAVSPVTPHGEHTAFQEFQVLHP